MKKAFTLAEALITLGIIGVIAALTLPAIDHMRPDQTKIKYLKAYDGLQQSVLAFASNTQEYPVCGENGGTNYLFYSPEINAPLMNVNTSTNDSISQRNNFTGNSKLCKLIAWGMNGENENCSNDTDNSNPPNVNFGNRVSFTTNNGIDWYIISTVDSNAMIASRSFGETVMIDTNRNNAPNCSYSDNCENPDRFWFLITADGTVTPADPMGKVYVNTRNNLTKQNLEKHLRNNGGNLVIPYTTWANGAAVNNTVSNSVGNIIICD